MTITMHNSKRHVSGLPARADRVCILVGVAACLGLADLWLTVHFMRTTGMVEVNPLARVLAGAGPVGLAAFKGASMLIHAVVLGSLRRRASAEFGAWVSVAALVLLTAHWMSYIRATSELNGCETTALACQVHYVKLAE